MSCDIIVPVYNQRDVTQHCLESIRLKTDKPYRIIVIDDCSDEETRIYLEGLARSNVITYVRNERNLGWIRSVNRALTFSRSEYVCIMNNDTSVFPGWLTEMIKIADIGKDIGIVNPCWELPKYYMGGKERYFKNTVLPRSGEYCETDWARGFCFLVKRSVIDAIGGLDEAYSQGYYDDWDFSRRAQEAGFRCVRAEGAFVWHHMNITSRMRFGTSRLRSILEQNSQMFYSKWGKPQKMLMILDPKTKGMMQLVNSMALRLLRQQHRLVILDSLPGFAIDHTNCSIFHTGKTLLRMSALLHILNNLRHRKTKRYSTIICSSRIKQLFAKVPLIHDNYMIQDIDTLGSAIDDVSAKLEVKKRHIVLGIGPSMFHDPAAALIIDGEVVAAAEEERFIREKHASNKLPLNAIQYCLSYARINPEDVTSVAFAWDPAAYNRDKYGYFKRKFFDSPPRAVKTLLNARATCIDKRDIVKRTCAAIGIDPAKAVYVEHHIAHAASAFHFSGFSQAAVLSIDGSGEFTATLVARAYGNSIEKIKEIAVPDSLGLFYSTLTEYLGFESNDGEYKLMGMASFGKAGKASIDDIISWNERKKTYTCNDKYIWVRRSKRYDPKKMYSKLLVKRFGPPRQGDDIDDHFVHIAAATQKKFEEMVLKLVDTYLTDELKKHGNLVFAGGCALNVALNGVLLKHPLVKRLWVQPASNDSGTSLGAAAYVAALMGDKIKPMTHAYLGPAFTNEQIENELQKWGYAYTREPDITRTVAQLLKEGEICGWFQGRMEWGPRALGNRSILGNPSIAGTADRINAIIKFRERWRPFCPSMLKEYAADILNSTHPSEFMTIVFTVNPKWKERLREVVHIDNTLRPQVVDKETNPRYHQLIDNFRQLTGIPVVINTSLNRRGEPMICSPHDAMLMFQESGLKYIALGDYLVIKGSDPIKSG